MNSFIDRLNVWGGRGADFAFPVLWQSSLLIALVFALDFLLRRKVRAAIRYSLWFVVFLKLLLPPTLALPTGAAWWLRGRPPAPVVVAHTGAIMVNYSEPVDAYVPPARSFGPVVQPVSKLSREGWMLLIAAAISGFLALWVLFRWRQIARCVRGTTEATVGTTELLLQARQLAGLRRKVSLRVTSETMSPAVCGLFKPVILLPQSLIEKLTANQLRAVLLHELIHLRRRDVWVNCAQTLLQIVYWWHPLLWVANARVRRLREEAVDDAVMCALNAEAEVYAPTLLEVAKLAFARPLASLGLVGILESRSALRHRIERLLNFTTPRRAGVSMVSLICLAAFTALAVPMGEPPARPAETATDELAGEKLIPYRAKVDAEVFARNIQTRADGTMHGTNDDLNEILVSIMDGFGVDCTGERAIQFNRAAGEVTAQNTSEALGVLDEVVRELNLKGGEFVLNPPPGLKQVLIEGQFYLVKPADIAKLPMSPESLHHNGEMSPWWELSPTDLTNVRQEIKNLGIKPMTSPRIQTTHGVTAEMFFGNATNNLVWKCVPYVHDGMVNLTVLARTSGEYAPAGKGWPDIAGHTNCAIFSRVNIENGGASIFRVEQPGAESNLMVVLTAKIVDSAPRKKPVPGDLPAIEGLQRSQSNNVVRTTSEGSTNLYDHTFLLDEPLLTKRLTDFAVEHQLKGISTNHLNLLMYVLSDAGVNLQQPQTFFYRYGALSMRATKRNLETTAEALGFNWDPEQSLNDGKSANVEEQHKEEPNTLASASQRKISQLVEEGKLLYQLGKSDEAGIKFKEALWIDPKNPSALHYMSLIKQVQARNLEEPPAGARGMNVPGPVSQANDGRTPPLPVPNPNARTNQVFTSPARQKIYDKLNNIAFDKISFSNEPMSEVARELMDLTTRRDIDQQGINFILNRSRPFSDPAKTSQQSDVDLALVKINLTLKNVRARDVLEAIVKSADQPIVYTIMDYGIEFSLKGPDELHTRTFRGDPNTFLPALGKTGAFTYEIGKTNSTQEIQAGIIKFFAGMSVDLKAPKSIFFNVRQGTLTVRATDDDLELIEEAISNLNTKPPEVTVKARFLELDPTLFASVFTNFSPTVGTNALMGILTEPAMKSMLKSLSAKDHSALINEGQVTTLSGRQASFQIVDVKTVVNGLSAVVTNNATSYDYKTTNMTFGAMLDVVPYVGADGYTIQLTVTPQITEFLGFENPKDYVKYDEKLKHAQFPLPKYRNRQVTTSAVVWDGQTLVLGNLSDDAVVAEPDGATLRQSFANKKKKQLVVLITPTIIDPSGNRVHSDDSAAK